MSKTTSAMGVSSASVSLTQQLWDRDYETPTQKHADEMKAWETVATGWKHLYGSIKQKGLSVEWHDFKPGLDLDWAASFHPNTLELCINLNGSGQLETQTDDGEIQYQVGPHNVALYLPQADLLQATRPMGEHHQFVTFEMTREYLRLFFSGNEHNLEPAVRQFIRGEEITADRVVVRPMILRFKAIADELLNPPVPAVARELWFQAKFLEVACDMLFKADEQERAPFCVQLKQASNDRAERVKRILLEELANPPTLQQLGDIVGCSPYHLSRIFSQATGMTIPQFIRQARMEKAAELLRSKRFNVTETAFEVGYNSLSHFSKVFYETYGCCPGLYPNTQLFGAQGRKADDGRKKRPATNKAA